MIKEVYIQFGEDNVPIAPCGFSLWEGSRFYGFSPKSFKESELNSIQISKETLVHGWVKTVHSAFKKLGVTIPNAIDYPTQLDKFLDRNIYRKSIGEVHSDFIKNEKPIFIKPLKHKLFTGHTIERFSDLAETSYVDKEEVVYCSDVINFIAEWRCFINDGTLVGMKQYYGDIWTLPDKNRILQMIREYKDSPIAYSLDVGLTDDRKTLLVEVNDCYSLGDYGLNPRIYTEMVMARWQQIVGD